MNRARLALLFFATAIRALGQPSAPATASLGAYTGAIHAPARVAADADGTVYVTDPRAGQVVVFDAFGRPTAAWTRLGQPLAVAVSPAHTVYVADEPTGRVSAFDAQGNLLYALGAGPGEFQLPGHLAADPAIDRTVYVADSKANLIKIYSGASLVTQFGGSGAGTGQFDFPAGIYVSPAGELFVVDQNNDRVQVFDRAGNFRRLFSLGGTPGAPSGRAQGLAGDASGRLYVADTFQGIVKVFDAPSGMGLGTLGGFGAMPGQLKAPGGVALDGLNRLFVTSADNQRLEVYGLDAFVQLSLSPSRRVIPAGTRVVLSATSGATGGVTYQWSRNGQALAGATNASFILDAAGASDGGNYSVTITSPSGRFTSSSVPVVVLAPPVILTGPQSTTVLHGTDVNLGVTASGSDLSYQWRLNDVNLDGATNSTLSLGAVETPQAGLYSVAVSNPAGLAVSTPAALTVLVPPMVMEFAAYAFAPDQLFHLAVNADPGVSWAMEATSDFAQWQTLGTNANSDGFFDFADLDSTNFAYRHYRLRWVP